MRTTRLGLPDNARRASSELLQGILFDALDLRLNVKHAHWTVRGERFQQLHTLFDSFVAPLDAEIDTIAERIAAPGGTPDGRVGQVSQGSQLICYPEAAQSGAAHLEALADRFAALGDRVRGAIDEAAEIGDADTSDVFTATSRFLDQSLWFLEAHLDPAHA